jgi:hypothetical protein
VKKIQTPMKKGSSVVSIREQKRARTWEVTTIVTIAAKFTMNDLEELMMTEVKAVKVEAMVGNVMTPSDEDLRRQRICELNAPVLVLAAAQEIHRNAGEAVNEYHQHRVNKEEPQPDATVTPMPEKKT